MKSMQILRITTAIAIGTLSCAPFAQASDLEATADLGDSVTDGAILHDVNSEEPSGDSTSDKPASGESDDNPGNEKDPEQVISLSQLKTLKLKSGSVFYITSKSSKSICICPPKSSVMSSTQLALSKNKKLTSQKWLLKSAGGGYYYLINAKSRKALTIRSAKKPGGSALIQKKPTMKSTQKWAVKGKTSECYITPKRGKNLCLTVGTKKKGCTKLRLKGFSASTKQRFSLKKTSYKLTKSSLLSSLSTAKGSSTITGFGGATFDKKSKAGKRVKKALAAVRRSSGACAFTMIDLETGPASPAAPTRSSMVLRPSKGPM